MLVSQEPLDDRAPAQAEDSFARLPLVGGAAALRKATRELGICCEPPYRACECGRVARRNKECALLIDEQLARGGRVGGDERRSTRDRLEGLVRNDPLRLAGRAEDPEGATR